MRTVITDWDGVLLSSELAKATRWYLAAMRLTNDSDVTEEFITQIATRDRSVRPRLNEIIEARAHGISQVRAFAGGSRKEVARRTAQLFLGDPERGEEEVKLVAERIREPLIEWLSEPLEGNLRFFQATVAALKHTYWDAPLLGLVTQTESSAVWAQFQFTRDDGSSLWGEFTGLLELFAPYEKSRGLRYAECAGDYERLFPNAPAIRNPKTKAYQVLCAKLGTRPVDTISFEDTAAGVAAAKAAGVACIGLLLPESEQDLSAADLVVSDSLERLIPFADVFAWADPMEMIGILRAQAS